MDTDLLRDRIFDTADICERTQKPKFLGFLSPEQAVLAQKLLANRDLKLRFFGGFEAAQRMMLGCFPHWAEEISFPITPITASFRAKDSLAHRDVLGTLMGLGLKREAVGDILIEEGRAVFFVKEENCDYIIGQISKIGGVGVALKIGYDEPLPNGSRLEEFSVTVASERLDGVVSALVGTSRGKAMQMIEQSLVTVNSVVTEKTTLRVNSGDIISVRTKGKFIIDSLKDRTRKDRIILKYKKYV